MEDACGCRMSASVSASPRIASAAACLRPHCDDLRPEHDQQTCCSYEQLVKITGLRGPPCAFRPKCFRYIGEYVPTNVDTCSASQVQL